MNWVLTGAEPDAADLFLSSPSLKYFYLGRKQLVIHLIVLYYRYEHPSRLALVVPQSLRNEVLDGINDCKTAGHLGQAKTLQKPKQRFIWHGMSNDCLLYVRSCGVCNGIKKPNRKVKARLGRYHAGAPLERVHINILGPLNSSKSRNKYVRMVIDQFTKWLECYPLKFFMRFGCPLQIHSDQGRNFKSALFSELCTLLEICKTRTSAYRPCSNGQVEQYNRLLLQTIRCCIGKNNEDWD